MSTITAVFAREILDSRGYPTVEVDVRLGSGACGRASVPSGRSTGTHEAVELRDGDDTRYLGTGVRRAVANVNDKIGAALVGMEAGEQITVDQVMIDLDGTANKQRLGANAILGTSLAVAKAAAAERAVPLYRHLGGVFARVLPTPLMNIVNGGTHADNQLDIQEFMIAPISALSMADAIRMGAEVFHHLKQRLMDADHSVNVGDEGGFAPNLKTADEALGFITASIEAAGYQPGEDVMLALDSAASEFFNDGRYVMTGEGVTFDAADLIRYYQDLCVRYPIFSIEDGMAEDDWQGWHALTDAMGDTTQLVGDDLFVTHTGRLREGAQRGAANAILVKPNQIGSLSETMDTIATARELGYAAVISHRSGDTEDDTIADIAVATNCGQIKAGSLSRSERTSTYNRLIRIAEELATQGTYAGGRVV